MLDCGPLIAAHRPGSRVGQQVDQDIVRSERKEVISGLFDEFFALWLGRHAQWRNRVDPEWLDDCSKRHEVLVPFCSW